MPHSTTATQDAFLALAAIRLADHTMSSVMEEVAAISKRAIRGAGEVSVTLLEQRVPSTVAFTGQVALDLDEAQYADAAGPCLCCLQDGAPVVVADTGSDVRWPAWARLAAERGVRSTMSIPVPVQPEVAAGLNVYGDGTQSFDQESLEVALALGAFVGVALANMHLYEAQGRVAEQMQAAMASRAVIEQAKGILMGARRCSADEAFAVLADLSQRSNRKLRDVAQALVDGAAPEDHPGG